MCSYGAAPNPPDGTGGGIHVPNACDRAGGPPAQGRDSLPTGSAPRVRTSTCVVPCGPYLLRSCIVSRDCTIGLSSDWYINLDVPFGPDGTVTQNRPHARLHSRAEEIS